VTPRFRKAEERIAYLEKTLERISGVGPGAIAAYYSRNGVPATLEAAQRVARNALGEGE
jgi:hypothetical protein